MRVGHDTNAFETWILGKRSINRLVAFEIWDYRKMLIIKWVDKVET